MIVPSNLLPQKGLDFDVDKESMYQYWTQELENGKIVVMGSVEWNRAAENNPELYKKESKSVRKKLLENGIVEYHNRE